MGTLGHKLDYLTDTKSILKQKINNLGGSLTDQSTFRSYGDYLDELYDEMPKVTGEGTEITLTPTRKGRMQLDLKGNTSQDSTTGKNLLNPSSVTQTTTNGITFTPVFENNKLQYININGTATDSAVLDKMPYTTTTNNVLNGCIGGSSTTYKLDFLKTGALYPVYNGEDVALPDNTSGRIRIVVYSGTTINNVKIYPMIRLSSETDNTYEPYTGGVPSPNPDYPQPIHVVTGNNSVGVQGKNLFDKDNYNIKSLNAGGGGTFASASNQKHIYIQCKPNTDYVVVKNVSNIPVLGIYETENEPAVGVAYTSLYFSSNSDGKRHVTTSATAQYLDVRINTDAITQAEIDAIVETLIIAEGTDTNISYEPYYHADYPINLGSLELCKIGDYQDYIYKENGNWYKHENISILTSDRLTESGVYWNKTPTTDEYSYFYTPNKDTLIKSGVYNGYCNLMNVLKSQLVVGTIVTTDTINFGDNGYAKIRLKIKTSRLSVDSSAGLKEWLQSVNLKCYIILATATSTQITDETLIAQLDAIENAMSTTGTTTISQTNSDLPFIISASALKPFTTETLSMSLTDGE